MPTMPPHASVDHYENFPVASWLCPPKLRPAVAALYHYARTADDLADEGDTPAQQRLEQLAAFRADVLALRSGQPLRSPWASTIGALGPHIAQHNLAWTDLLDLLDAFMQDVRFTATARRYADMNELLDYCRRSANPVGRLMLRLMAADRGADAQSRCAQSDAICTALQLINFWQDLSIDVPRGRHYIPSAVWQAHGLPADAVPDQVPAQTMQQIVHTLLDDATQRMRDGAALPLAIPGRMGWELRAVVQGGLRISEQIAAIGHCSWQRRVRLRAADAWVIAWRCLQMRR